MLGTLLLAAFVWGLFAFAVAIDASRRGDHGGFWAVVVLLTGPFGTAAYLLVVMVTDDETEDDTPDADPPETVRVCPTCSTAYDDPRDRCAECDTDLGPDDDHPVGERHETGSRWYCGNCTARVGPEVSECPSCSAVF
ncbi:hypothetical protein [Halomarina rubra]|uniref:DZANK-type domain-containing protein n=1 Tax=Halomarina rubra TaxID=2071873 RepID=A0ABD6B0Y9_9EURY|nr:hypothetical protein [Halomarina rubra]